MSKFVKGPARNGLQEFENYAEECIRFASMLTSELKKDFNLERVPTKNFSCSSETQYAIDENDFGSKCFPVVVYLKHDIVITSEKLNKDLHEGLDEIKNVIRTELGRNSKLKHHSDIFCLPEYIPNEFKFGVVFWVYIGEDLKKESTNESRK